MTKITLGIETYDAVVIVRLTKDGVLVRDLETTMRPEFALDGMFRPQAPKEDGDG